MRRKSLAGAFALEGAVSVGGRCVPRVCNVISGGIGPPNVPSSSARTEASERASSAERPSDPRFRILEA